VYDFFNVLESFLKTQAEQGGENETAYDTQIRLTRGKRAQPGWSEVENRWDDLGRKFLKTREGLEKIYADWQDLEEYDLANYTELLNETAFSIRRIRETEEALNAIVAEPNARAIYWAEINKNTGDVSLHAAPLHVGQQLQKNLFASKETVILTSATLCVDGSFSHVKNRLGLGDWADELAVGSPFDFESAALVYIPNDVPEPGQPGYQKAVESALVELFKATRGRGLVLFTSHAQLQNTYRAIARNLEEDDVIVLAQGLDGSRRQVLETFKSQERMVLFGTKSFWEGIDVVGEALSCLAIARLPFSVPSDPIFAARSETFDDPFAQYAVPEAVLRFRQGFGRLIRAKTDRGIIVVLDKRVLTKVYGRVFLDSLPPCSKKQGPLKELPQIAAEWIDRDF
jgi:DNA polymerase-3 subunit epsilon/ATP-dependent DNA helicase DinG